MSRTSPTHGTVIGIVIVMEVLLHQLGLYPVEKATNDKLGKEAGNKCIWPERQPSRSKRSYIRKAERGVQDYCLVTTGGDLKCCTTSSPTTLRGLVWRKSNHDP